MHSRLGKRSHVPTAPTPNPPSTRGGRGRGAARGRGRGGRQSYTGKRQSAIGAKIEHVEFDENVSVEMLTDQLSELLHEDNKVADFEDFFPKFEGTAHACRASSRRYQMYNVATSS